MIKRFFNKFRKITLSFLLQIYLLFRLKKKIDLDKVNDILVIAMKPLGFGDLMMNSQSIIALKKKYPNKKVILLSDYNILKNSKYFDEQIIVKNWKEAIKIKRKFDMIILPNKNLLQSFVSILIKKNYFIGYFNSWKIKSNFNLIKRYKFDSKKHYYEMSRNVMINLGIDNFSWDLEKLYFNEEQLNKVKKTIDFEETDKIIIIHPYVNWKSRTWPKENYKELIQLISKFDSKIKIIVTGGPEDIKYNSYFDQENVTNLTGKLNLFELSALFSLSNLIFIGDCGPMHIAISENSKIISFWGPVDPLTRLPLDKINKNLFYFYPKEEKNAGEYDLENEPIHNKVINKIDVREVFEKVKGLLGEK